MELGELEHVDEPAEPRGQEGQPVWVKHATETFTFFFFFF